MSTKRWTEAEWRADCARRWPDLATRARSTGTDAPIDTKALARGGAVVTELLEARIILLEARLRALEGRGR